MGMMETANEAIKKSQEDKARAEQGLPPLERENEVDVGGNGLLGLGARVVGKVLFGGGGETGNSEEAVVSDNEVPDEIAHTKTTAVELEQENGGPGLNPDGSARSVNNAPSSEEVKAKWNAMASEGYPYVAPPANAPEVAVNPAPKAVTAEPAEAPKNESSGWKIGINF